MSEQFERRLLRDEVYHALRRDIVTSRLPAGTPLRDAELAAQYGTSKEPVRSALLRLRAEGLVESKPQSGTRVAALDERAAAESLDIVRTLSLRALELAMPHLTAVHLDAMREANSDFAAATATSATPDRSDVDSMSAAIDADDRFHDVLLLASRNRALRDLVHQHSDVLRRLEAAQFADPDGTESLRRHDELLDACARGDLDGARSITSHIWSSLESHLTEGPS